MHYGVTFNFVSAKVCSPAIFETCFSYEKDIWIAATDYCMYFYIIVLLPLTAISLNCAVLILYFYIHFLSLNSYFMYLNIIWTFI